MLPTGTGKEGGEKIELGAVQVGPGASQPQGTREGPPGCLLAAASQLRLGHGKEIGLAGQGCILPHPQEPAPNFQDRLAVRTHPAACLCVSALLLLGMSKCKMQKPGRTTQPKDQLWLAARPVPHPGNQRPGQQKVRASGRPQSTVDG